MRRHERIQSSDQIGLKLFLCDMENRFKEWNKIRIYHKRWCYTFQWSRPMYFIFLWVQMLDSLTTVYHEVVVWDTSKTVVQFYLFALIYNISYKFFLLFHALTLHALCKFSLSRNIDDLFDRLVGLLNIM